jgi:transcriptional regulator with XRE-family HTH domain
MKGKKEHLKEAIMLIGGVTPTSKVLGVPRTTVNDWVNVENRETPYPRLIDISHFSGKHLDLLEPEEKLTNQRIFMLNNPLFRPTKLSEIMVKDLPYLKHYHAQRLMILNVNRDLVSGLGQKQDLDKKGVKMMSAIVLNVDALWSGEVSLKDLPCYLLVSEKIAIGLYLEDRLGKIQGKRNDILQKKLKNDEKSGSLVEASRQVKYRKSRNKTVEKIASILGMSDWKYRAAKKVYLQGIPQLIDAVDYDHISINRAATIIDVSMDTDFESIEDLQMRVLHAEIQPVEEMAITDAASQPASQEMLNEYEEYANEYTN